MPFHRYECGNCGHEFRYLHLAGVEDDVACPKCESKDVQRLLPRVAVQFKGSGYYKTDRANKKSKAGTKGHSEKETSTESSSSDSKSPSGSESSKSSED